MELESYVALVSCSLETLEALETLDVALVYVWMVLVEGYVALVYV